MPLVENLQEESTQFYLGKIWEKEGNMQSEVWIVVCDMEEGKMYYYTMHAGRGDNIKQS